MIVRTPCQSPSRIQKAFSAYPHGKPHSGIPIFFLNSLLGAADHGRILNSQKMQTINFPSNLAEITVTYSSKVKFSQRQRIGSSKEAVAIFRAIWSQSMELREECYILLLNRANHVLGWYRASQGGASGTVIDPKLVFGVALKCNACSVILAHNHPSGNTQPSSADLTLTKQLVEGGKLLEISVLDHVILTAESFFSFADEGHI